MSVEGVKQALASFKSISTQLEKMFRAHYPDYHAAIVAYWKSVVAGKPYVRFSEAVYCYVGQTTPFCHLNQHMSFQSLNKGYSLCGKHCACAVAKKKLTMKQNHGVEHALQSATLLAKAQSTLEANFGTTQLHKVNCEKKIQTNQLLYGANTPLQSAQVQAKSRATLQQNTGYSFPFQNPNVQTQIQNTWQSQNPNQQKSYVKTAADAQQASKNTIMQRYPEHGEILLDSELLERHLIQMSRQQLANLIGCCPSTIDKKIQQYELTQFCNVPSYYEVLIENFLLEHQVVFEKNTRSVIAPKELDFYLPAHKLAIEFNGLRWHGEQANRHKYYHVEKTQACAAQQIQLIHVFQDEWDHKNHIVKSILTNRLGHSQKIHARQCQVLQPSHSQVMQFLDQNHLQGAHLGSVWTTGLQHQGELVSVITMTVNRGQLELKRMAVKGGLHIVGGASKMFAQVLAGLQPSSILSYCDLRYFNGQVYKALGFDFQGNTEPGYHYTKGNQRFHRLNFTKSKLVKEGHSSGKTEKQIMQELGYDRIWDCGHGKWIWSV